MQRGDGRDIVAIGGGRRAWFSLTVIVTTAVPQAPPESQAVYENVSVPPVGPVGV
jgi:hypothetical protein